ncbi:hypothetical protein C8R44DRAFT_876847 [Mycena epipterygia]|nr:hypothetical protein C8R44DRAFT_876847 [Mycena epipterygia]
MATTVDSANLSYLTHGRQLRLALCLPSTLSPPPFSSSTMLVRSPLRPNLSLDPPSRTSASTRRNSAVSYYGLSSSAAAFRRFPAHMLNFCADVSDHDYAPTCVSLVSARSLAPSYCTVALHRSRAHMVHCCTDVSTQSPRRRGTHPAARVLSRFISFPLFKFTLNSVTPHL